jgi:DNA topoisomerase-3
MEGAGKLVEDEDLAEAMKERGLGTPATRAEIIDGLIYTKYIERQQRELVPTAKAEQLLEFLGAVGAEALTKPHMTGEWEHKLRQMEHGRFPRKKFMAEIVDVTRGIVERTKKFEEHESTARETDIVSPTDGKPMLETLRAYKSQDGVLTVYKVITGRKIEEAEVRELVTNGEIGPLDGFVSPRTGNRFPSKLKLAPDPKDETKKRVELDFGNKVDLDTLEPFWTDPKSRAELCEGPTSYILREREGDGWKQAFSVGRLMCKKEITRDQAIQMVTDGKTELIKGFTSKKGRPFDAFLLRKGQKIAWEFPPREKKVGKDGKPRAPRKTVDLSKASVIGKAPQHDGELVETSDAYHVRKPAAEGSRSVFKLSKTLCGHEISPEDAEALVTKGKTGLISGFVSKRGLPFSAYLILSQDKSKAEFEFPPR